MFRFLGLSIAVFLILILGIASFSIQYKIEDLQNNIIETQDNINKVDIEIRVLQTELSHLSSISNIKSLSSKYLKNFHIISNYDFINIFDIPINPLFE